MRTKLLLLLFIISSFAFSTNYNENARQNQIENLQKENENLKKEIENLKLKSESISDMIDKVDSMYQNNFDRMIFLFGFLGAIVSIVLPFWIQHVHKRILEIKEKELNASNEKRIEEVLDHLENRFTESKIDYDKKLKEEKVTLQQKLDDSNEEKIKRVLNDLEQKFTESEYNFYNKLDEHKKILEEDINEKTEKLDKNIRKTNHSLIAKNNIFHAFYFKDKDDYDNFVNFKLSFLYNNYKAGNCDLHDIVKGFEKLIIDIENKNVTVFIRAYKMVEFFENELITTELEISEENLSLFDKFKDIIKIK